MLTGHISRECRKVHLNDVFFFLVEATIEVNEFGSYIEI